jgi:glycosyltransferase involved in cell wall biosynthesis
VRLLIFHGYLLSGTGSNVFNARLAEALARAGHEVHLLCQEQEAERLPFVDAVGRFEGGGLTVQTVRRPRRLTVYLPPIGRLLPVFVRDHYTHFEAKTFLECSEAELERYLAANVAAVSKVAQQARVEGALANHLLLGPAILARALPAAVPYAVKVHGSDLLYALQRDRERFLPWVQEGVERAEAVLVGSTYTASEVVATLPEGVGEKLRLFPPGVEVELFTPYRPRLGGRKAAVGELVRELRRLPSGGGDFRVDGPAAAKALAAVDPTAGPLIAFVGKLIPAKGVDIALLAHQELLGAFPTARLLVVGFGPLREPLERLVALAGSGQLADAAALARQSGLPALGAHLEQRAQEGAGGPFQLLSRQLSFLGHLDHPQLAPLLSLCDAVVVPSRLPEAFGMIAAEAAAAGALPVCAGHSGLQEVAALLAAKAPPPVRPLLSFPLTEEEGPRQLARRLIAWLYLPSPLRAAARRALVEAVRENLSWERVAQRLVDLFAVGPASLPQPLVDSGTAIR